MSRVELVRSPKATPKAPLRQLAPTSTITQPGDANHIHPPANHPHLCTREPREPGVPAYRLHPKFANHPRTLLGELEFVGLAEEAFAEEGMGF